jgi:hypothetical protein
MPGGAIATNISEEGERDEQSEAARREREQQALGERQARQAHPARADGSPDSELPAAFADACQHEVGDVHAGDQQENGHRAMRSQATRAASPTRRSRTGRTRHSSRKGGGSFIIAGHWDCSISLARSGVTSGLSRASTVIDVPNLDFWVEGTHLSRQQDVGGFERHLEVGRQDADDAGLQER